MADPFRSLTEQQEAIQRAVEPLEALRRRFEPPSYLAVELAMQDKLAGLSGLEEAARRLDEPLRIVDEQHRFG